MNLDPYDAKRDADSELRYEADPRAEPEQWEVDASYGDPVFVSSDEQAGFRG